MDGVEVDVRADRNGDPVVIHDIRIDRTTAGKGQVSDYSFGEMQGFDAGAGEHIPSLRAVIELAKTSGREVLLDLKSEGDPALLQRVVSTIEELGYMEACLFSSFSTATLRVIQQLAPQAVSGLIISFRSRFLIVGDFTGYDFVSIRASAALLNPFLVRRAREADCQVLVWFGRWEPRWLIRLMMAIGVDGLIVNNVSKSLQLLSRR